MYELKKLRIGYVEEGYDGYNVVPAYTWAINKVVDELEKRGNRCLKFDFSLFWELERIAIELTNGSSFVTDIENSINNE